MRKIIQITLCVMGALLVLNTLILLIVSNYSTGILLQALLGGALIAYGLLLEKLPKKLHIAVGILALIPVVFVGFLGIYGNVDNASTDEDVVIVLGAGIHGEQVSAALATRLDEAALYHEKNPNALIVVCGGQGLQESITEALAMERYLLQKGVAPENILKEDQSTSTWENLVFAKALIDERFSAPRCVVITNDFHVYRATLLAQRAELDATHIGADTAWYTLPANYLREMAAVVKTWLVRDSSSS